jgi:hypothetical protein
MPNNNKNPSDFKTITSLKVFKNLLVVSDNLGGLVVLDLEQIMKILDTFIKLKKQKLKENLEKHLQAAKQNKDNKKHTIVKKKNFQAPDYTFKDFDLDLYFDWKLISIEQCHSQKIIKIMDLDGQAILTSGNDCKTKLWVVKGKRMEEIPSKMYTSPFQNVSKR